MKHRRWTDGWRLNVALTAGVMATVLMALILAQLDALQAQPAARARLAIANIQATAVSSGSPIRLPDGPAAVNLAPDAAPGGPLVPDVNPRTDDLPGVAPEFPVCGEVPAGWLLYTVVEGDTIAGLAAATGSDPAALLSANCLTGNGLSAGMQILLPAEPAAAPPCGPPQWWVRYQVQAGDTLAALARSRNTTVAEVLRANCRDSEALAAGQFIFLPPGGPAPIAPPPVGRPPVIQPPPPTATVVASPTSLPPTVPPTTAPPNPPAPTAIVPTIAPIPTRVPPTLTPPPGATVTPPGLPTLPPTPIPPTPRPTNPPPTNTPVPTRVPPTLTPPPPPTNTPVPLPTNTPLPPPTSTPVPPPTVTPPPPPTNTPVPPPTNTPEPPPTSTPDPAPEPTTTPEPGGTQVWYRPNVWQWYWR